MKKTFILVIGVCFSLISQAQVYRTISNGAGMLSFFMTSIERSTVTNLTVTGTIDARDFKTMRDSMIVLAVLDISRATITAYSGPDGTRGFDYNSYMANTVPCNAYMHKISLTSVNLPTSATGIDESAIADCTGLNSIIIPSKVTYIAEFAFASCTGLSSVTIPPSVLSIGRGAFMNCVGVTSIKIPSFVSLIGSDAFRSFLGVINVDVNNPNYSSIDGVLFNKNQTALIQCPTLKTGNFIIPSSVTSVGRGAFSNCSGLTIISIPSSVTSIDSIAFVSCSGLTKLTIPSSVSSISGGAFSYCTGIGSIYTYAVTPIDLNSSMEVFKNIDKTTCILNVPFGTKDLYSAASQWKDFTNIVEMPGFSLFSIKDVIEALPGSTAFVVISSEVNWTATSNQAWLSVNPTSGIGMKQKLTFTAQANVSTTDQREAMITISAPDQLSQTVTVTQKITVDPIKLDAFEPDNSINKASIIKSGDIQQHSIYPFQDVDYASFELTNAPAQVEIKFNTISVGHQIQLLTVNGSTVLYSDNSVIKTTLTQNGKYYIKAWNPDSLLIPEYQLSLNIKPIVVDRYEPDNTWEDAKLITPFIEQDDHTIQMIGDVDYVKFTISDAPRTIYVDVTDNRLENKSFGVWLLDTNGTTILNYSQTPKINSGAYIEQDITVNGTYYLKIALPQGESGSTREKYTIDLKSNGVAPYYKCNPTDSLALVAIYNSMNGADWTHKLNWLTGNVQNWQRVTLSPEGRVTKLNLSGNNLKGSIPTDIGLLTELKILNLGNTIYIQNESEPNDMMYSTLPLSMANLVNLEVLSLDALSFYSVLPDVFSGMTKLRELYLNTNGLTNIQLPVGILSCSKLETLAISGNLFSQLPDLKGLTNLQSFSAKGNMFTFEDIEPNWTISGINYSPQYKIGQSLALNPATGTLVTHTIEVGGEHNLYQWSKNNVPIPGQTTNTLRIENVSKSDAGIYQLRVTNTLATQLTLYSETLTLYQKELPVYKALEAIYNSTGGANWLYKFDWLSDRPFTAWQGISLNDYGMYSLDISYNNLIGSLPANMGDLTFFSMISINSNPRLTGSIPESIGNLDQLQYLNLRDNNLSGEIPSSIGNLKNIIEIFLSLNQLNGSVPATIVNCRNLELAILNDNNLENLPNLSSMLKIIGMYLYNNQFEFDDLMPERLGNLNLYGYNPQKKFGKEEFYNKQLGDGVTITALVGGTGNQYQWYKDGNQLKGKTTDTLVFASLAITDQGSYICKVVNPSVPNLTMESKAISIYINRLLVAKAGTDQSVNEGAMVTLDGSSSRDVDGYDVTYKWTAPKGITLSSATAAKPTFTAPPVTSDTIYTISLVVNDKIIDSPEDQVLITVMNVDQAPYVKSVIQDVSAVKGAINQMIDLKTIFADDDISDVLSYVVTSNSNSEVISATITNSTLILSFSTVNTGTSDIVITASSNVKEVQSKFKVEVKLTTGIDGLIDNEDFQIYPNPTSGIVHLKFSEIPKTGSWITVFDLSGKTISESAVNEMQELIDLSGNTPGIYFIQIDNNPMRTYKIILK